MDYNIRPIGVIHSSLKKLEDCPLQESENAPQATIEVFAKYKQGLKNIKTGSKLILITWLHESDRSVLTTKPRNDPNAVITGVFSTRSPDRPNPIGLHSVEVVSVDANKIHVSSLEVLDQTPLIDMKIDLAKN
jgi:tRNA-Thr(GGU) m(6)t(6)A37 methyltransferase TsaA